MLLINGLRVVSHDDDAAVEPDRHELLFGVRFEDADSDLLRQAARQLQHQSMRTAGMVDFEPISIPLAFAFLIPGIRSVPLPRGENASQPIQGVFPQRRSARFAELAKETRPLRFEGIDHSNDRFVRFP